MDIFKSFNISIETVMRNLEMLIFVHDHLNIKKKKKKLIFVSDNINKKKKKKKMYEHAVKKYYPLRYVPDQCETQQMCDEGVLENGGT